MDLIKKLSTDLIDKKFTDVCLIFINATNPTDTIKINVHKAVLGLSSDYFLNLFTFSNNKTKTEFEIIVDDVKIACEIILSFYGQIINSTNYTEWEYLLKTFKCRDYFALKNDIKLLYNLVIPQHGFELFLEVVDQFDYMNDLQLFYTIRKNIPIDYNLETFSKEFIQELLKIKTFYVLSRISYKNFILWDSSTGEILKTVIINDKIIKKNSFISNKRIIYATRDEIKILDIDTDTVELVYKIPCLEYEYICCIKFFADGPKAVIRTNDAHGCIKLIDAASGKIQRQLPHTNEIIDVAVSPDNNTIMIYTSDLNISTYNIETGNIIHVIYTHIDHYSMDNMFRSKIAFSLDNYKIYCKHQRHISFWDVLTGKLLFKTASDKSAKYLAFSPDSQKTAIGCESGHVKIYSMTGNLISEYKCHEKAIEFIAYLPDGLKIITCSTDADYKIWDVNTGRLINNLNHNIITDYSFFNVISDCIFSNEIQTDLDKKIKGNLLIDAK